jgi:hypothetical protein
MDAADLVRVVSVVLVMEMLSNVSKLCPKIGVEFARNCAAACQAFNACRSIVQCLMFVNAGGSEPLTNRVAGNPDCAWFRSGGGASHKLSAGRLVKPGSDRVDRQAAGELRRRWKATAISRDRLY